MKHPSGIHQAIVDKVAARRGRLHAFERIDPAKTALVVVDMDIGTVRRMYGDGDTAAVRALLERINTLARMVRRQGGIVAWVTTPAVPESGSFRAIMGEETAQAYRRESEAGETATVAPELDVRENDLYAAKLRHSAFFPGNANLHEQLQPRGIDTVIIAGTVTNVCCESSARDAYELDYRVILASDALRGHGHGLHEGTLAVVFRNFGDVRPGSEILQLLQLT